MPYRSVASTVSSIASATKTLPHGILNDASNLRRIQDALTQTQSEATSLVLDLDETLILHSSTELFIRHACPRFLAILLSMTIDLVKPWRFSKLTNARHIYRDWLRVVATIALMPWTLLLWRRAVARNARQWANIALLDLIRDHRSHPVCVATFAQHCVAAPLVRALLPDAKMVASGSLFAGWKIRAQGKALHIAEKKEGPRIDQMIVVTDSDDDADLLDRSRVPLLMRWEKAKYRDAFADSYIPFLYTQRGKRPGKNYLWHNVLMEDVVLLCFAFGWTMAAPVSGLIALVLLHLSFWMIYEIGYARNDSFAARNEAAPMIWDKSAEYAKRIKPHFAWLTAGIVSAAGAWLLAEWNQQSLPGWIQSSSTWEVAVKFELGWLAYLFASFLVFELYNRTPEGSRVMLYAILQIFRTVGYGVFFVLNLAGILILLSLILARWIPYMVYRQTAQRFPRNIRLLMIEFYIVLVICVAVVDVHIAASLQTALAFVWLVAKAHKPLRDEIRKVRSSFAT